jgi:N-methylhydantoinase B
MSPRPDAAIDPVTLAVLAGRLEQIADEMDATLFRAAFNPIIAEAHDASHGLYHATTGDTLVQGKSGLPIFVGVMAFAVKAVIDKAAGDGDLADGDVYVFNDAHIGRHAPVGHAAGAALFPGRAAVLLARLGRALARRGRRGAGQLQSRRDRDAFQEAFVLPPVKLVRAGRGAAGHRRHPDAQHAPAAVGLWAT